MTTNIHTALCLLLVYGTMMFPSFSNGEDIPGVGPIGQVQEVQTKFQFTEGPAVDGAGNLFFSDIPANRILMLDVAGKLSVFLEPSGICNGLMFNKAGTLFACSMNGRLISIDPKSKKITTLTETYKGERYNAPNDLVLDQSGGIYFTDPRFRAPKPWPQVKEAVYYYNANGTVTRLVDNLMAPNGVILSPDEKTLYVIPSMQQQMWAYPVTAPGKLGAGRVFCELKQPADKKETGGDGLTIDTQGNLYITSQLGIQVFNPQGKHLGILKIPQQPANVTFGGKEMQTLYITARSSLYAVKLKTKGHVFTGKVTTKKPIKK